MNKEELVRDMNIGGSLGCSDREAEELKTLRGREHTKSRSTALGFRRAKCSLFRDLLERILWNMALERRGVSERWVLRKGPSRSVGNEAKVAGDLSG